MENTEKDITAPQETTTGSTPEKKPAKKKSSLEKSCSGSSSRPFF